MRLRTLLILAASLLVASLPNIEHSALAQAAPPEARLFDEFEDIQFSDLMARLDNFAIQLQTDPSTRGFLIVYRTRRDLPGLSNRYAQRMKSYLVKTRGISKERVITVDGGVASCLTQQLWIAPPGTAPKPKTNAYSRVFVDIDSVRLFDEFSFYSSRDESEVVSYPVLEDEAGNLEAFAETLRGEPRSRAHVIAYGQYYIERGVMDYANGQRGKAYKRTHLDPPGTAQQELRAIRNLLVKTYGIAPSRISIIDGGHRKVREVELWIVPTGEVAPIATPNSFPGRNRRSRK
jgi:hypothetical protein